MTQDATTSHSFGIILAPALRRSMPSPHEHLLPLREQHTTPQGADDPLGKGQEGAIRPHKSYSAPPEMSARLQVGARLTGRMPTRYRRALCAAPLGKSQISASTEPSARSVKLLGSWSSTWPHAAGSETRPSPLRTSDLGPRKPHKGQLCPQRVQVAGREVGIALPPTRSLRRPHQAAEVGSGSSPGPPGASAAHLSRASA